MRSEKGGRKVPELMRIMSSGQADDPIGDRAQEKLQPRGDGAASAQRRAAASFIQAGWTVYQDDF